MAAAPLGLARCPLCGGTARASLSKNQLAVLTCQQPTCGIQLFTRSDAADERARALILPASEPTEPPEPTRYDVHRDIAEKTAQDEQQDTGQGERQAAAAPATKAAGFGLLGNWFTQPQT